MKKYSTPTLEVIELRLKEELLLEGETDVKSSTLTEPTVIPD